jgi:ubiquinone/menaquinone biosynthesis C-methylase UbiE
MAWDKTWDDIFQKKTWGKYPHDVLISFIAKNFYNVPNRKQIKILEIGSGSGANIWYLTREGFDARGIDGSPTGVQQTIDYLAQDGLKAEMSIDDVTKINYPDNYFNCVIDFGCTGGNSLTDTKKIIKEAYRVLKKDGLFFSECVANGSDMGSFERNIDNEYFNFSEGPFAGLGFWKSINRNQINEVYGEDFNINSVDFINSSVNNGQYFINKWIIVCSK